jgi:hypothetical protein
VSSGRLDGEIEALKKHAAGVADPVMLHGLLELIDRYERLRALPEAADGYSSPARARSRWLSPLPIVLWIAAGGAYAMGFRLEKPGARLANVEGRVVALEKGYTEINTGLQTVIRLQCLAMTRHDADLAGACKEYPTRDEPTRR